MGLTNTQRRKVRALVDAGMALDAAVCYVQWQSATNPHERTV